MSVIELFIKVQFRMFQNMNYVCVALYLFIGIK